MANFNGQDDLADQKNYARKAGFNGMSMTMKVSRSNDPSRLFRFESRVSANVNPIHCINGLPSAVTLIAGSGRDDFRH